MRIQQQQSAFGEQLLGSAKDASGQPVDWSKLPQGGTSIDLQKIYSEFFKKFQGDPNVRNQDAARMSELSYGTNPSVLRNTLGATRQQTRGSAGYGDITDSLAQTPDQVRRRAQSAVEELHKPELAMRRSMTETQLSNQGLAPGSEAHANSMREVADAESRAQLMAIAAGRDEASQMFGQQLQEGQFENAAQAQGFGQDFSNAGLGNSLQNQEFMQELQTSGFFNTAEGQGFAQRMGVGQMNNAAAAQKYGADMGGLQFENEAQQREFQNLLTQAKQGNAEAQQIVQSVISGGQYNQGLRAQSMQELLAQRSQPLNEMNAFMTGQQVQMPQFFSFGQSGAAKPGDISGAMDQGYQSQLDTWGAKNQQTQQTYSAIASAVASYFSDRRLKRDIEYLFTLPNGIKIHKYRFIGKHGMELGVIAQEVMEIMPDAVHKDPRSGFFMVDYDKVLA